MLSSSFLYYEEYVKMCSALWYPPSSCLIPWRLSHHTLHILTLIYTLLTLGEYFRIFSILNTHKHKTNNIFNLCYCSNPLIILNSLHIWMKHKNKWQEWLSKVKCTNLLIGNSCNRKIIKILKLIRGDFTKGLRARL